MDIPARLREWIYAGKQVGKRRDLVREGEAIYQTMGVQRSGDVFVAYYFEIPEALMAVEENALELRERFETLESALAFLEKASGSDVLDMTPQKRGKIFHVR
ncbi:hypothetical protein HRD49_07710 [Corallococcus exiguus]|uniref:hypothetical protein n=1 Tax=Corallococcus TaxID=83461 RepID=UPI000EA083D6|nr:MULTISPECIES: hypothetical protein [Corallococcus]NNC16363.1 hypothetical protein [Corallococcus exiguus]NRD53858.1 hypothetical protein [Corallococcus exiguus]NRD61637.1 hypothetical protein [Corallococcus exiguus]RKH27322.1 hypothetical protein D7V77_11965 [Corallococcus sp. CA041A]RKI12309.1 hypothetical protein D7Y15_18795 [Corallococcus sp. AB030]